MSCTACSSVSRPSVQHTSMSMALTSRTMVSTCLNAFFLPTSRQAEPMQKRVLPAALARLAISITSSTFLVGSGFTNVLWCADCEQYLQSSVQPPVLMDSSVHCCTSRGSQCMRCTVAALYTSSSSGCSYTSFTSSYVQFYHTDIRTDQLLIHYHDGSGDAARCFRRTWRTSGVMPGIVSVAVDVAPAACVDCRRVAWARRARRTPADDVRRGSMADSVVFEELFLLACRWIRLWR